jgi:hypothetical protein
MTQELERPQTTGLLNVETGELLPLTVDNAAQCLGAARAMKVRLQAAIEEATEFLVSKSEHLGTKTLRGEEETVTLSGGIGIEYDLEELRTALEGVGCPESRIDEAIVATVTYKENRSVLRQLAGANAQYAFAIKLAEREVEKPYRASVKLRRAND